MKDLLVKHNETAAKKFGIEPENRSINELLDKGVIIVDKDSGPTSSITVDNLKKVLDIPRAGHSGTLDPKVTGVLVCGLGRGTRLMEYMLKSNKEYVCLMYLHEKVEDIKIKDSSKNFIGIIEQIPPIISAVKRQKRKREIYSLDILDVNVNQNVLYRVKCQHGTYIRKLCTDWAENMGVKGQMIELRRTKAGPFTENDSIISLDKLRNLYELYLEDNSKYESELRKYILPMEDCLRDFKRVYVRDSSVNSLSHGSDLAIPGVSQLDEGIEVGEEVQLLTLKGELIGMGIAYLSSKDVMKKSKGAFVKTGKVFIDIDYYPKEWVFAKK